MGGSYSKKNAKHAHEFAKTLGGQEGKTFAITGTTGGLGFHAARVALEHGATVYCLNRPSDRAQEALQKLQAQGSIGDRVQQIDCDLQNFDSVRSAAKEVSSKCSSGLDVLCNNAGIMAMPDKVTADGYEQQMQTNHLSHFLLSSLLLPSLEKAAAQRGQARIVNHSSCARLGPDLVAKNLEKGESGSFGGDNTNARYARYHQTKLANIVFTFALQDRLKERNSKVFACCAHPGIAASNLQANTLTSDKSKLHNVFMGQLMKFSQSEEDGSMPLQQCMMGGDTAPGAFYGPSEKGLMGKVVGDTVTGVPKKLEPEAVCTKQESKDLLWQKSEKAVGTFFQ